MLMLALVVCTGTIGFMLVEGWGPWESFYFTFVTITTVGYGDYGITVAGERFAIALMLIGIGVLTYTASQVIQTSIELSLNTERKMIDQIERLKDHVVVCGLGRIGRIVCRELAQSDTPFVVIEQDDDLVTEARESGWLAYRADATEDDSLILCGIKRARAVVCATSSDNVNIVTTLTVRDLCPNVRIISRADDPSTVRKIQRAGASEVISPIWVGAKRISDVLLHPTASPLLETSDLSTAPVRLHEFTITAETPIAGRLVRDLGSEHPSIVFVTVHPADGAPRARPGPDYRIRIGDEVIVAGEPDALVEFDHAAGARIAA